MPDYAEAETDTALADPHANFEREYILSNGGDIGSPGFSIYREGSILFFESIVKFFISIITYTLADSGFF